MTAHEPSLTMSAVTKSFGSVRALSNLTLSAFPGEIHAVVGDNGAGKSTMIKIIAGIHQRDSGTFTMLGADQEIQLNAAKSQERGIAVVHQDLALVECLDIATNMTLGSPPRRYKVLLDRQRMRAEAAQTLATLNVRVGDPTLEVGLLSGGQRQIVAIARAVRMNKPIVLLDEPTASLGVRETGQVGEIVAELPKNGKTVLLVSHDLDFVMRHAKMVTVLRLGRTVASCAVSGISRDDLVKMITGLESRGSVDE